MGTAPLSLTVRQLSALHVPLHHHDADRNPVKSGANVISAGVLPNMASTNYRFSNLCDIVGEMLSIPSAAAQTAPYKAPFTVTTDSISKLLEVSFPTFSVQGVHIPNCFHSSIIVSKWMVTRRMQYAPDLSQTINLTKLKTILEHYGMRDLPVYYYTTADDIQLYSGVPRSDDVCLMYYPPSVVSAIPGLVAATPAQAHITTALYKKASLASMEYALYSPIPPLPTDPVFWHAPHESVEYKVLNSMEPPRACLCQHSCPHEPSLNLLQVDFGHKREYTLSPIDGFSDMFVTKEGNHSYLNLTQPHSTSIYRSVFTPEYWKFKPTARAWLVGRPGVHHSFFRGTRVFLVQNATSIRWRMFYFVAMFLTIFLFQLLCYAWRMDWFGHYNHVPRVKPVSLLFPMYRPSDFSLSEVLVQAVHFVLNRNNEQWVFLYSCCLAIYSYITALYAYYYDVIIPPQTLSEALYEEVFLPIRDFYCPEIICRDVPPTFVESYTPSLRAFATPHPIVPYIPEIITRIIYALVWAFFSAFTTILYATTYRSRQLLSRTPVKPLYNRVFSFWSTEFGAQLHLRLAGMSHASRAEVRVMVRRLLAENGYPREVCPAEIDSWLDTLEAPIATRIKALPLGACYNCLGSFKVHQGLCKKCTVLLRYPFYFEPILSNFLHVGLRPIPSIDPRFPKMPVISSAVKIQFMGHAVTDMTTALALYHQFKGAPRGYGYSCGFVFQGITPTVFIPCPATALVALCARMGVDPPFTPEDGIWLLLEEMFYLVFPDLICKKTESKDIRDIISGYPSTKRLTYQQALAVVENGNTPRKLTQFGCFPKLEKAISETVSEGSVLIPKIKAVPRLINNPKPELNILEAPYTIAFSKLMGMFFGGDSNILWASGKTPDQINTWFQSAWEWSLCILEDDVSFMDLSQSGDSLHFVVRTILRHVVAVPQEVEDLLYGQIKLEVKTREIKASLGNHNASGVPTTTISNSLVCILSRLFALAYSLLQRPLSANSLTDYADCIKNTVLPNIRMAVAGDDGYLIIGPRFPLNHESDRFLDAYAKGFSLTGLDVGRSKIRCFNSGNWRLGTFLAMRPYYGTAGYEFGPEIARRLTGAFWRLSGRGHPGVWLKGVAVGLSHCSSHVPVIQPICQRVLSIVSGPSMDISSESHVDWTNPYSTFYQYQPRGQITERGIQEFCGDYDIPRHVYEEFLHQLELCDDVFVNISHPVLEAVFARQ